MQPFQSAPIPTFRDFGGAMWSHLRRNLPTTIAFAAAGAVMSWAINVYWIAKRYQGTNVPGGAPVTSGGNMLWGMAFWIVASTVLFSGIAHWRAVGTERFLTDIRDLPSTVVGMFRSDGPMVWSHAMWGFATSLALTQVLSPSLRGLFGVTVLLTIPSVLGRIALGYSTRVWTAVVAQFRPGRAVAPIPLVTPAVVGFGAALAMLFGFLADDTTVELIIALAVALGALAVQRSTGGQRPGHPTMFVLLWVAMVALGALGGAKAASADDGGYSECGSSWSDWWGCKGASDVRSDSAVGALVGAVGGAIGSGMGPAMAEVARGGTGAGSFDGESFGGDADNGDQTDAVPTQPVVDEFGNTIEADDDGLFGWTTPDGTEMLTREEILERIADAREANASRDVRHEAIVAEQTDDQAAQDRFDDLREHGLADDAAAAADLAAHLDHEAAQDRTRQQVADMLQERAETGGWGAIAERLEQGDSLSREDLQAIRDGLDRLTAEQGSVDPATTGTYAGDLWDEFASDAADGQEALASVVDHVYGPAAGWVVRNPSTAARVGLGVATGGFSEGVIAPWEMTEAMERAAEAAHAEGRDLTYGEAVMAAAWHVGPGMLLGHAAEMGISAAGPTISRWGGEALESMERSVDDWFDGIRTSVDDGAEITVREGSEVYAESVARQQARVPTRSVRGSAELAEDHGLRWNPDEAVDGVRSMEPGTIVPQSRMADDYGMSADGYRQLRGAAQRHDVAIEVRSRSGGALERVNSGSVPKPPDIKIKSGGEVDSYIGMNPTEIDHVPWKPDGDWVKPSPDVPPPHWPSDQTWDEAAFNRVNSRYEQRMQEFVDNKDKVGQLFADGRARHNPDTGNLEWNVTGGRRLDPTDFKPIAGDHDLFTIEVRVPASVRDMGPAEVERYVESVRQEVLHDLSGPPFGVQHGAHLQWEVPATRQAQQINAIILNSHAPPVPGGSGDALLRIDKDMPAQIVYYQGGRINLDDLAEQFPD